MIRFQCPDCKTIVSMPSVMAETQVACPRCKIPLVVPTAATPPKRGIFIEEYEDPRENERRRDPSPAAVSQPPLAEPSLTTQLTPPLPPPTEKDWRTEPPLPLALPEEMSPGDSQYRESEREDDDDNRRPTPSRRSRPIAAPSLIPATLLIIAEALFGAAALATAFVAFLRTR